MRVNFTYIILNCLSNANRISIKVKFVKNHTGQLILLVTRWLRHYDCVPIQLGGHRNKKNLISKIVAPPCLVRFSFYLYAQIVKLLLQLMSIHMYMICPHNLSFIYMEPKKNLDEAIVFFGIQCKDNHLLTYFVGLCA